jgi:type IV pilus assembly protein PilW
MKQLKKMSLKKRQHGVSLVELMITLVIGLVLMGALTYFYLGSQQMNRTHDDVSRMQESGRNAMEILGKAIRQAGFRLDVDQPLYVDTANNIEAIIGTAGGGTGASALPDTITIRHDPVSVASATNPIQGKETTCLGNIKTSNNDTFDSYGKREVNTQVVEYSFSVLNLALKCSATASNPATGGQIIVDNIENMQITYGIGDGLGSITAYKASPTAVEFTQVTAVKVSLLIRGPSMGIATNATNKNQTYTYNGEQVTSTDGYLRQVYTSTFTVRNQAF